MGLSFVMEVAMWLGFGYWGFQYDNPSIKWLLGLGTPVITLVVWGYWAAPKSEKRLKQPKLVALKLALFLLATVALIATGKNSWAVTFLIFAILNQSLEFYFDTRS